MNSDQFEMAILIAMAIFAVAAVASIIRGRRNSWVQSLPARRAQAPADESQVDYDRRTNYGMF
jgi:hypothetical protein